MALNLKNQEAEQMARQLAQLTGESLTDAIKGALKERLEREEKARKRFGRMEWLRRVTRETSAIMNDGKTSTELIEELYDPETGLPR